MSTIKRQLHTVVRREDMGDLKVLCFDEMGRPCIYADESDAELQAAKLRSKHPDYRFGVLDSDLL